MGKKEENTHKLFNNIYNTEKNLISCALSNSRNIKILAQYPVDFIYSLDGKDIFKAIKKVIDEDGEAILTTIYNYVPESAHDYFIDLSSMNTSSFMFDTFLKQYSKLKKRLDIIPHLQDTIKAYEADDNNADELFLKCGEVFNENNSSDKIVSMDDITKKSIKQLREDVRYIPYGISSIDTYAKGTFEGHLIYFAAPPSCGKTTAALQTAVYQSTIVPVLFFSLEMPVDDLYIKMISHKCRIDSEKLEFGNLTSEEIAEAGYARDDLKKRHKLFIWDAPATRTEILTTIRKYVYQHGVKTVIIDYIQLITGLIGDTQNNGFEDLSRSLKLLARELNISIIALSQLTKDFLKNEDRAPTLGDLRGSGAFAQDGDAVIFFYVSVTKGEFKTKEPACSIAKYRKGKTGKVKGFKYNKAIHMMS